jgi:hypothetical protein
MLAISMWTARVTSTPGKMANAARYRANHPDDQEHGGNH